MLGWKLNKNFPLILVIKEKHCKWTQYLAIKGHLENYGIMPKGDHAAAEHDGYGDYMEKLFRDVKF